MAITSSGIYVHTFQQLLAGEDAYAWDLDDETLVDNDEIYGAMVTNAHTPGFTGLGNPASWSSSEVSGTGYTAGGAPPNATGAYWDVGTFPSRVYFAVFGGTGFIDWPNSTITNARALILYNHDHTSQHGLALFDFGADYSTSNGTFRVDVGTELIKINAEP